MSLTDLIPSIGGSVGLASAAAVVVREVLAHRAKVKALEIEQERVRAAITHEREDTGRHVLLDELEAKRGEYHATRKELALREAELAKLLREHAECPARIGILEHTVKEQREQLDDQSATIRALEARLARLERLSSAPPAHGEPDTDRTTLVELEGEATPREIPPKLPKVPRPGRLPSR